jgi:hypothetical protein
MSVAKTKKRGIAMKSSMTRSMSLHNPIQIRELAVFMLFAAICVQHAAATTPGDLSDDMLEEGVGLQCSVILQGGAEMSVSSCPNYRELCCSEADYLDHPATCALTCTCSYTEEVVEEEVTSDYVLIRGVPEFYQFNVVDDDWTDKSGVVGCGPVAVASLMLWYQGLGWSNLAAQHQHGDDEIIDWQNLTEELGGADYLDTWMTSEWGMTYPRDIQRGVEAYLGDRGYSYNITHLEVTDSGAPHAGGDAEDFVSASEVFPRIRRAIDNGRPVILAFDTDEARGGGIGSAGDGQGPFWNGEGETFGFVDHFGLIVGYNNASSPNSIWVNMGHGYGALESFDWHIGGGQVHLWFVELEASEKNPEETRCPTDEVADLYHPYHVGDDFIPSIGATCSDREWFTKPMITRFVADQRCETVGEYETGVVYSEETREETLSCELEYGGTTPGPGQDDTLDPIDGPVSGESRDPVSSEPLDQIEL